MRHELNPGDSCDRITRLAACFLRSLSSGVVTASLVCDLPQRSGVEHYRESDKKLDTFDPGTLEPALRGTLLPNAAAILAQRDTLLAGVVLSDEPVNKLMDYMHSLTDESARDLSKLVPARVPSKLPVAPGRRP